GVDADIYNPGVVTVRGEELVSGVKVASAVPAYWLAPQADRGTDEAAVLVDPERVLRGSGDRLYRSTGLAISIDGDIHQVLLAPTDDRGYRLPRSRFSRHRIRRQHPIPELDLLDRGGELNR